MDKIKVRKLLEALFGMSLTSKDFDSFLKVKINKKLKHWCPIMIDAIKRGIIINNVLLSIMFYFIFLWRGTKKDLSHIKSSLSNYLAKSTTHKAQIKLACI